MHGPLLGLCTSYINDTLPFPLSKTYTAHVYTKGVAMFHIGAFFNNLSPKNQGHVTIMVGLILLCNALNLIKGLNTIIILVSFIMIWYGIIKAGYDVTIRSWLHKQN